MTTKGMPHVGAWGGGQLSGGGASSTRYSTTDSPRAQEGKAPSGSSPAYLKGGLIYVEGRHLASVRGCELCRSFDGAREMLHGCLFFRVDVLLLAETAGASVILATERQSGQRYTVALETIKRRGRFLNHAIFGAQLGLPLSEWQRLAGDDEPSQLSLFGGGL